MAAAAATRSTWIIPTCLEEIQASRSGKPQFFPATAVGETFPPAGEVWALAYSAEGKLVAKLDHAVYQKGTKEIEGKPIRYIATLSGKAEAGTVAKSSAAPILRLQICLEFPATSPVGKRRKIDFYSRIP